MAEVVLIQEKVGALVAEVVIIQGDVVGLVSELIRIQDEVVSTCFQRVTFSVNTFESRGLINRLSYSHTDNLS